MKAWPAIALLIPIGMGLAALIPRPTPARAEPVLVSPPPETDVPEEDEATPVDVELEEGARRAIEREKAIERLEVDYEDRVERLIESIDWTDAESRARFPVEYARIRAELHGLVEPP